MVNFIFQLIMTELLQQAIAEIEKLSPNQQDAIASRLLAEVQDEQQWETSFNKTTDDKWDKMAEMVRQEIRNSKTVLLNQIFPE